MYIVKDFNYISSGKKSKMINLDISSDGEQRNGVSYICGIENGDETMDYYRDYNKFSLKSNTTDEIIHPLYDIKDVCLKSDIKKSRVLSSSFELYKSDNYIDIYAPQLEEDPIDFVLILNNTYCLTKRMTDGPVFKTTTLRNDVSSSSQMIDSSYKYLVYGNNLRTYTYASNKYENLSDNFKTRINLNGVKYNYMFELPLNNEFNDFDNGDVHADIFQGKNTYDSTYSMNMNGIANMNGKCREYCGIGNGCGEVFLKYHENIDYTSEYAGIGEDGISTYNLNSGIKNGYDYQKIETVTSINRFRNTVNHKSSLFSIEIRDTGLNVETDTANKIKLDIRNNIRTIVKTMCPANTQLFDVFFSGN